MHDASGVYSFDAVINLVVLGIHMILSSGDEDLYEMQVAASMSPLLIGLLSVLGFAFLSWIILLGGLAALHDFFSDLHDMMTANVTESLLSPTQNLDVRPPCEFLL